MQTLVKFVSYLCVLFVFGYSFSALAEEPVKVTKTHQSQKAPFRAKSKGAKTSDKELETIAFKKMSPEQISKYLIKKNAIGSNALTGILVPTAMFMTIPLCLFILFYFRTRSIREKQQTLRVMVENGAQIPPEMFIQGQSSTNPLDRDRRRGLLFSLSSIGFIVFLLVIEEAPKGLWAMGLIPLLLGVGYLVSWRIAINESTKQG